MQANVVELTRKLLAFDTINPPGDERDCARYLGSLLDPLGFELSYHEFAERRTTLLARLGAEGDRAPLCLTGHIDVVPLGGAPWKVDPFAGEVDGGRIYGRGASDMKAALAAMVIAARRLACLSERRAGLLLAFTAGEETFCEGARHLTESDTGLGSAGAMIVGEPTGNRPFVAHKGCVRYSLRASGVTAHASLPEQGENAIYKAAEAALALRSLELGVPPHPVLGRPTVNVGTISGGININSVPDAAVLTADIRTIAGQTEAQVRERLRRVLGSEIEIELLEAGEPVSTDSEDPWIREVFEVVAAATGEAATPAAAPYFTDAALLKPALGAPPTIILGPGEVAQAHRTDEWCEVAKIEQAVEIYWELMRRWVRG